MGFGQGLSGLNAAAQELDIIGNNIANSGTVGFKSSSASFADVYASSRVGLGTQVSRVNQRFTIGTIAGTGNQFDIAIDGAKGLFRLQDPSGSIVYSRNGEFFPNKDMQLVNAQGHQLTGYAVNENGDIVNDLVPINVPMGNINPQATTNITYKVNLDGASKVIPDTVQFDPGVASSFTMARPMTVFDSLGSKHVVTQYFIKREPNANGESVWEVHYGSDSLEFNNPPSQPQTLRFDSNGLLVSDPIVDFEASVLTAGGSPAANLAIDINYAGSTQFSGSFSEDMIVNGYATGEYASMTIAANGAIEANYTNGAKKVVGYIALADFNNLQGLQPIGGNAWIETATSGQPILGTPGSNGLAQIKGQAVEESNVDLSQELVNMIIAQRTYQANAQTIQTQDQVLQTLINMR